MKFQADKKRREVQLEVGELVLVKLQPYRQHSVVLRKNKKLSLRYFGPFEIIEKIGEVAFKLLLPDSAKIHPVFHISLLKKFLGDSKQQYFPLPLTTTEFGPILLPYKVLDSRVIHRNDKEISQVQVQWNSFIQEDNSWEDVDEMQKSYPEFNLEDKVVVKGMSNVTRVKEGSEKAGEFVKHHGHVSNDEESKEVRKSSRERRESVKLCDYNH